MRLNFSAGGARPCDASDVSGIWYSISAQKFHFDLS
jgi:hypothetical protein